MYLVYFNFITTYNYCCPLKVFDRYKIRAGFLALNSVLSVTFVFYKI